MGPRIPPPFADPPQPTRNASKLHADFGECPPGPGRWLRSPPRLRLGERVRRAGGGLRWLARTAAGRRSQPAALPPPLRPSGYRALRRPVLPAAPAGLGQTGRLESRVL